MEVKNHEGDLLTDPENVKETKTKEVLGKVGEKCGCRKAYRTGRTQGEKWKWRP